MGCRLYGLSGFWKKDESVLGRTTDRGISLQIGDSEWIYVAGANGVGKSTLFSTLTGLTPFTTGRFELDGKPIDVRNPYTAFRAGITYVPQRPRLPGSTSLEEVTAVVKRNRLGFFNERAIRDLYSRLLNIGLVDNALTGRQFDLVTSIASVPRVLLIDEPVPHLLKSANVEDRDAYKFLGKLLPETIVLFTDHYAEIGVEICDRVLWLKEDGGEMSSAYSFFDPQHCPGLRRSLLEKFGSSGQDQKDTRHDEIEAEESINKVLRFDRSVRSQIRQAIRSLPGVSIEGFEPQIFEYFPFLESDRTARALSGGQRIILAWFLVDLTGLGNVPGILMRHIDHSNLELLSKTSDELGINFTSRLDKS